MGFVIVISERPPKAAATVAESVATDRVAASTYTSVKRANETDGKSLPRKRSKNAGSSCPISQPEPTVSAIELPKPSQRYDPGSMGVCDGGNVAATLTGAADVPGVAAGPPQAINSTVTLTRAVRTK